jgi:hypothetical protein
LCRVAGNISKASYFYVEIKNKSLFLKVKIFAFAESNGLQAAWNLAFEGKPKVCPQSYPQILWIGKKCLMKRILKKFFQKLH